MFKILAKLNVCKNPWSCFRENKHHKTKSFYGSVTVIISAVNYFLIWDLILCSIGGLGAHMYSLCVTQYYRRYILSTFEENEIFALYNRRFNKLSSDTKFLKNEVILYENTSFTKCEFIFIFFIFYTLFCSLSQIILYHKPGWQDVPFVVLGHIFACFISASKKFSLKSSKINVAFPLLQ